jgi:hypothetical protein
MEPLGPSPQPSPRKRGEGAFRWASIDRGAEKLPLPACLPDVALAKLGGERAGVRGYTLTFVTWAVYMSKPEVSRARALASIDSPACC